MSVAIKKENGVDSVEVSLNEGKASIRFKPESTARYEHVRAGIERNGFVVKDTLIRARGRLQAVNGALRFVVSGSGETFSLRLDSPDLSRSLQEKAGQEVVLEGTVPTPDKNKPQTTFKVNAIK